MSEEELAEHLSTLLGDSMDVASSETVGLLDEDDTAAAASLLERQLPETIDADIFINNVVGMSACIAPDAAVDTGHNSAGGINHRPGTGGTAASQG